MTTRFFIIFLFVWNVANSQKLIPEAEKIKSAFEKFSTDTNSKSLQYNYVTEFPSDSKTFLRVFQTEKFDQLYLESYKYLKALEKCSRNFPKEVISKYIDIGKNLVWDADAVGGLQHLSVELAIKQVKFFVDKYKTLDIKEQQSLINFYADVENHNAYQEYQVLINKLNKIGETDIAKKLETARTIRKKRQDH
ncbi:MAG: hypothetical protein ABI723_16810 [Bacteroidia bacterium]